MRLQFTAKELLRRMLSLAGKRQRRFTALRCMQADGSTTFRGSCHGQIDLLAELQCTTQRVGLLHILVLDVQ